MAFKFPVIHGINLASGSYAQNFVFESLASDPLPAVAGRVWLNTATKTFKYSTLSNTGSVVVRTFASQEDLLADIATLQANLDSAATYNATVSDALRSDLNSEIARATLTESTNATNAQDYTDAQIAALVGGAPAVLDTLKELALALQDNPDILSVIEGQIVANAQTSATAVAGEADRALAAEATLRTSISSEATDRGVAIAAEAVLRIAGDAGLDTRLITVEGQVNGKIGDLSALLTTDKSDIVHAVDEVFTSLVSEKSRAIAAELILTTDLSKEVADRTTAISAEFDRASAAELILRNNLAQELVDRTTAVSAEFDRAVAAELVLTNSLDQEVADRIAAVSDEATTRAFADAAIRSDYNAKGFGFASTSPAMQHTITHGLNTAFYVYTVLVKGADGVFRNDVVPVEETNSNEFVVYLASAADVRVSVKSLVNI